MGDQSNKGNQRPPAQPPTGAGPSNNGAPPGGFNPAALPAHIQEQLMRQMQSQHQMARMQQHMPMRPPPHPPQGMPRMPYPAGPMGQFPMMGMMPVTGGPVPSAPQMMPGAQSGQGEKSRPGSIPPNRLAALSQVLPFFPGIDEASFTHSLTQFLACVSIPLRKPPVVGNRPISLLQLFNTVNTFGGFARVSESRRWPAVAASLSLNPTNMECMATLHSLYHTLLYPYEQFMIHKVPADAINWPPAITKSFEMPTGPATVAAQPGVNGPRLASALNRVPSTGSVPAAATAQAVKPTVMLNQYPLESLNIVQMKGLKALEDPFVALRKGRVSFLEICLYLECGFDYLVRFGLNQLQILLLDGSGNSPDPKSIQRIIKAFTLMEHTFGESRSSLWHLSREASSQLQHDLGDTKGQEVELFEMITAVLRCLFARPDCKGQVEACMTPCFLDCLLEASVRSSSFEIRKNSMLILSELAPALVWSGSKSLLDGFIRDCGRNLMEVQGLFLGSTHRLLLSWEYALGDVEALKKGIVNMIPASTSIFKTLPGLLFVQLETLYKLLFHAAAHGSGEPFLQSALERVLPDVIGLFRSAQQPVSKLCRLLGVLMSSREFRASPDYSKWVHKILHSASFGLPDGGYLELLALILNVSVQLLDESQLEKLLTPLVDSVISAAEGIRSMWCNDSTVADGVPIKFERLVHVNNPTGSRSSSTAKTVLTEKSPLVWQQPVAVTSHPYQLYLVLIRLLDGLILKWDGCVGVQRALQQHQSVLLAWFSGAGLPSRLSQEVLMTPDLRERYGRLLSASY